MRLESLSLPFALLSVVTAAAPDFLSKFPASAVSCGPYRNTTTSADFWCKLTATNDGSGCCIVDTANWSEEKAKNAMQEWCDSISANTTVKTLNCSSDTDDSSSNTDDSSPFSTFDGLGDNDDSSETASSSASSDSGYNTYSYDDDNNGLSRSTIVGIVMGIIAGLFVIIMLVRGLGRSKHSSRPPKTTSTSWRIPDQGQTQFPRRNSSREPVLPVRVSTPPPVYSAPPPAYHA